MRAEKMSEAKRQFISCFAGALHPGREKGADLYGAQREFWEEILDLSVKHHVAPVIYDQLAADGRISKVPEDIRGQWRYLAVRCILEQERRTQEMIKLCKILREHNILALVMKGAVVREVYPHPDYRMSSDEDFLIHLKDLRKCDLLLRSQGFEPHPVYSSEERSYTHRQTGFRVEIHTALFKRESVYNKMNVGLENVMNASKEILIHGERVRTMNDTDHMIYLVGHFYQHFTGSGVGIRQLGDIVLYAERFGKQINWGRIDEYFKMQKLEGFWRTVLELGIHFLEFDAAGSGIRINNIREKDKMEEIILDILESGVFGKSSPERRYSGNVMHTALLYKQKSMIFRMAKVLFPGQEQMKLLYPWVENNYFLVYPAYVLRAMRCWNQMVRGHENPGRAVHIGMMRIRMAKKYGMLQDGGMELYEKGI